MQITLLLYKHILYSRKIWRFGGLCYNRQIKIRQNFLLAYICMAILYQTAKFKSANILAIAIMGSTAKFNFRQYFRLYSSIGFRPDPPLPARVGYMPDYPQSWPNARCSTHGLSFVRVWQYTYCSVLGKCPFLSKQHPCSAFQGVSVTAYIQGNYIPGKHSCRPKL